MAWSAKCSRIPSRSWPSNAAAIDLSMRTPASCSTTFLLVAAWVLEVALRHGPDDLHAVPDGDLVEPRGVRLGGKDRGAQLVEVADHRGRGVQVQLSARTIPDPEAVS